MVGPIDWVTTLNFPTSCCAEGATTCNVLTAFQTGCRTALTEVVKLSAHLIAWFSIGFGAVMVRSSIIYISILQLNSNVIFCLILVGWSRLRLLFS